MTLCVERQCTVRPAMLEDLPGCIALLYALKAETHWRDYPDFTVLDATTWFAQRECLLIAEVNWKIIGICGGSMATHPMSPTVRFVIEQVLYVSPDYRGGAVLRALVRAFKAWGQAHGAQAMVLGKVSPFGECLRWHAWRTPHVQES